MVAAAAAVEYTVEFASAGEVNSLLFPVAFIEPKPFVKKKDVRARRNYCGGTEHVQ